MTDYFVLLEQPRRPWLDENALHEKFHSLARTAHPDRQPSSGPDSDFASLSEAFRVLSDPKLRLQHLLQLEQGTTASDENILPKDLEDLFPSMTAIIRTAEDLLKRMRATTNALSRSLFKSELLTIQNQIAQSLAKLLKLNHQTMSELRVLDESWTAVPSPDFSQLRQLYLKISYLSRWITQLEEKKLQLSFS
jgi:curved DNA-binding protein CbpA